MAVEDEDFTIENVLEGPPDMADVAMVIVNVQTADGRQYAIPIAPDDESQRVSVTAEHAIAHRQHTDDPRRLATTLDHEVWTFVVKRRSV